MRLTFVVKGNRIDALEQMRNRGILATSLDTYPLKHETVWQATVPEQALLPIMDWFGEFHEIIEGYGYPDRTCLSYSQHD